jgi:integrase
MGYHKVNGLTSEDLEGYQETRLDQGIQPSTVDMEISHAQTMVTKAFDNDKVDGRALKAFRRTKRLLKRGEDARDRVLTIEEYLKLVKAAGGNLKPVLIIAMNTGMRRGELMNLRWSYIDRDKGFIRLPADVTKEGKAKIIPMNHHVSTALESLPRALHHDYVFTWRGEPISGDLRLSLRRAAKITGIPYGRNKDGGFTLHDVRATAKTNMLRAGVDKVMRDLMLGHALAGMDIYYLKPSEEDLRAAMDLYTAWFDRQITAYEVSRCVSPS